MKHVQISARIPADLADALERAARESDRTFSAEIRRAIKLYLMPTGRVGEAA
ncbi:MAG: ribbon-helix-helix protein, CopG family [Solirubrobacteraceae bacterium]